MASKILYLLFTINLILKTYAEETTQQEEYKSREVIEEYPTTVVLEEEEEQNFTTTTDANIATDAIDEASDNVKDSVETVTDDVSNFVTTNIEKSIEEEMNSNFTNINTDVLVTKTETVPVQQTTSKALEEEATTKDQDNEEEPEVSGLRNPKAENGEPLDFTYPAPTTRSIVRSWLQDCWIRPPAGLLVPLRAEALARALAVWSDLNTPPLNLTQVLLMGYDSNGVNWRSRHNLHPSANSHEKTVGEALSKLLLKYQGVNTDMAVDGTMRALATAAKLVPYDSALFVITDQGAGDTQRLPLALRALVEKRLKVYTVWTDPAQPSAETEEIIQALRNVSKHTEGEVIQYPLQVMDMESSSNFAAETELEQWNPLDAKSGRRGRLNNNEEFEKFDLLLVRRGGGQAISLGVPVENGVSALRIFIEGAVEHAVLYPPNDAPQIDLYNATSVSAFSSSSTTEGSSPREVYLIFPGTKWGGDMLTVLPANPTKPDSQAYVGTWHLSIKCSTCDYRLYISARTFVHFYVEAESAETLKFRVTGPVASVRESQLVDEYGTEFAKLPFSYQPMAGEDQKEEIDPMVELVADVPLPPVKGSKIYVKIVGRDLGGEPFVRLAGPLNQPEVRMGRSASIIFPDASNDLEQVEEFNTMMFSRQQVNGSGLPYGRATSQIVNQQGTLLTTVQIGLATRLYGSPGDNLQLHFEVTNYREQSVRFSFGAVGELRMLTGISPSSQTVASGQTVNVIVSLTIPASVQSGARDTIVFTAYGNEQVSTSVYVYVINPATISDVWAPEIWHTFQGSCLGRTGDDCAQHAWSTTVTARDPLTGLLRLSSSPIGLMYTSDFISGSREQVVATYRATCCAPRVVINAVDAFGNTNSHVIDISNYLTEATIAAIVLGVFLLIALIALIIFLIVWCVRKRRESRELPYTSRT